MIPSRGKLRNLRMDITDSVRSVINIGHIFLNCDLDVIVWGTIDTSCPTPINTNYKIID